MKVTDAEKEAEEEEEGGEVCSNLDMFVERSLHSHSLPLRLCCNDP